MKQFHTALFVVTCLFKSITFCLANQPTGIDESQYFQAFKITQELSKKPFKIYLAMRHPAGGNRFRLLNYTECQQLCSEIDMVDGQLDKSSSLFKRLTSNFYAYCLKFENGSNSFFPFPKPHYFPIGSHYKRLNKRCLKQFRDKSASSNNN